MTKEQDLGLGVFVVGDPAGQNEIIARRPKELFAAIGQPLVEAFVPVLIAIDRLASYTDALEMNYRSRGEDTVRHQRNHRTYVLAIGGIMHELRGAIEALDKAGVTRRLSAIGQTAWQRVVKRMQMPDQQRHGYLRNQLYGHLGAKFAHRGAEDVVQRAEIVLRASDGGTTQDAHFDFALDVVLAGLHSEDKPYDNEHLDAVVAGFRGGHEAIAAYIELVFWDVLRSTGVRLNALTEKDLPELDDDGSKRASDNAKPEAGA